MVPAKHVYLILKEASPLIYHSKYYDAKRLAEARAELTRVEGKSERFYELEELVRNAGRNSTAWEGPVVRVFFPDEGSAALARRDWTQRDGGGEIPGSVLRGIREFGI